MMPTFLAEADGFHGGLLVTAFGLGLRHGVDWDHIAAIADLTSGGGRRRRSLALASLYAFGHAVVIVALGTAAVVAGDYLPDAVDDAMGRVVGVTLLVLGGYVLYGLVRHGSGFRMRSRWSLLAALARRAGRRRTVVIQHDHEHSHDDGCGHGHVHERLASGAKDDHEQGRRQTTATRHHHTHVHVGTLPDDPDGPSGRMAFAVGMLHGVGTETPTQVVLFVTAAGAAGVLTGELLLVAFTFGLLLSNTGIALAATTGFLGAERRSGIFIAVAALTGAFSIALGLSYVVGLDVLPPLLTG